MKGSGFDTGLTSQTILHRSFQRKIMVVCLVSWPLNESEAGVDFVLIETSMLFVFKFLLIKREQHEKGHLQPHFHFKARQLSK